MNWFKVISLTVLAVVIMAIGFKIGDWYRDRKASETITELQTRLAKAAETIEVANGVYSEVVVVLKTMETTIFKKDAEIEELHSVLDELDAKLLAAEQVALTWKKAYQALLDAQQTDEPPPDGEGPVRKRVSFSGKLGPIQATGHTLTDPPEAFLKLEQVDPLRLTMTISQLRDGTWVTHVASSDDNVKVDVGLAAVNPFLFTPKWYQRIWADVGVGALGDPSATIGLSYRGDRYSVGGQCFYASGGASGCGATLGVRIFK